MSIDPEKTRVVQEWSRPEDRKAVKSFLQIAQFCAHLLGEGKAGHKVM